MEKNSSKYNNYLDIHNYAINYTKDNRENASDIINAFSFFLNNYAIFLTYGSYSIKNNSIRKFISLYNNKDVKNRINQYKYSKYISNQICCTAEKINYLLSDYTYDDLYNECVCALLYMAEKYNDTKPSFHNYVKKCFHYRLKISIDKLTSSNKNLVELISLDISKDQNGRHKQFIYVDEYEQLIEKIDTQIKISNSTFSMKGFDIDMYNDNFIDFNWINGISCNEVFSVLNNFERSILVESYINKKTDKEIALKFGLARETINRKKRKAVKKMQVILEDKKYLK